MLHEISPESTGVILEPHVAQTPSLCNFFAMPARCQIKIVNMDIAIALAMAMTAPSYPRS
jgi:NADH:ubiquinone oxidoreductase subunit H